MKTAFISAMSLFASASALAGSHVSIVALPHNVTPISDLRIESVKYGKVVVGFRDKENCDHLDDYSHCVESILATKVRVSAAYKTKGVYVTSEDVNSDDRGNAMMGVTVDFDPSKFSSEELARLSNRRTAKSFFSLSATQELRTIRVIDWKRSDDCRRDGIGEGSPDYYPRGCTPHYEYKDQTVKTTLVQVKSND